MSARNHRAMQTALASSPQCRTCGTTTGLQVHHVVPRRRTQKGAEAQDNLVVLCVTCHRAVHDKDIDLQSYLTTEEQAHAVLLTGSLELARQLLCPSAYRA